MEIPLRGLTVATTLLLAGAAFGALAPPAAAFFWCAEGVPLENHDCTQHLVCVGGNAGHARPGETERCQYGVPWRPCEWACVAEPPTPLLP